MCKRTYTIWWCTFHGQQAKRGFQQELSDAWCWYDYRHECTGSVVEATLEYKLPE